MRVVGVAWAMRWLVVFVVVAQTLAVAALPLPLLLTRRVGVLTTVDAPEERKKANTKPKQSPKP